MPPLVLAGALALIPGTPRGILVAGGPVQAGVLFTGGHELAAGWAGVAWLAEAERAVGG
jgi:hypothetical protein